MNLPLNPQEIIQMRIETFGRILQRYHPDLFEKHQHNLSDPMLRRALRQVIALRKVQKRAEEARLENERYNPQLKKLRRPYFS